MIQRSYSISYIEHTIGWIEQIFSRIIIMPQKKRINIGLRRKKSVLQRNLERAIKRAAKRERETIKDETVKSCDSINHLEATSSSVQETQVAIDETVESGDGINQPETTTLTVQETQVAIDETVESGDDINQPETTTSTIQETQVDIVDEWFWSLPGFGLENDQLTAEEACSSHLDSSPTKADEYLIVLDSFHSYPETADEDEIMDALKYTFFDNLCSALRRLTLPPNWVVGKIQSGVVIVQFASTETMCPVVRILVLVDGKRNVHVHVHNDLVDVNETWLKVIPKIQISQSIRKSVDILLRIVKSLNNSAVCCGNFEEECFSFYEEKLRDQVEKRSRIESLNFSEIAGDGTAYSRTVRASNCIYSLKTNIRCKHCSKLRQSMQLTKYRKRLATSCESLVSASSTTPFISLTTEEKHQRLKNLSTALILEKKNNRMLKKKIESLTSKNGLIDVSVNLCSNN